MSIQWYPGHMVKARRQIQADLKLIDVVVELADARIPEGSRNPDLTDIHNKPTVLAISKTDLADPDCTKVWIDFWRNKQDRVVALDINSGQGISQLKREIRNSLPDMRRIPRVLVVGVPNVGKSSLINRLAGRGSAKTGAKPGVTRGKQWINADGFRLLDTPGILWPKFDDQENAKKLAVISAIKDEILNTEELAHWLLGYLKEHYWKQLSERYKLTEDSDDILKEVGKSRGCLLPGGVINTEQAASVVLTDFRTGKLGRISLEWPEGKD